VESVHLVAIRNSGRRQEAQDVSLAITDKYDNIPFSCASEWGNHLSRLLVTAAHGFGTMMIRQQSISEVWPYVLRRQPIQNCHNGNQIERSVHAPDLPTRAKFDHPY
jgi:hypothetical protein